MRRVTKTPYSRIVLIPVCIIAIPAILATFTSNINSDSEVALTQNRHAGASIGPDSMRSCTTVVVVGKEASGGLWTESAGFSSRGSQNADVAAMNPTFSATVEVFVQTGIKQITPLRKKVKVYPQLNDRGVACLSSSIWSAGP